MFKNSELCKVYKVYYNSKEYLGLTQNGKYTTCQNDKDSLTLPEGGYSLSDVLQYARNSSKILSVVKYDKVLNLQDTVYYDNTAIQIKEFAPVENDILINNLYPVRSVTLLSPEEIKSFEEEKLFDNEQVCLNLAPYTISEDGFNLSETDECFSVSSDFNITKQDSPKKAKNLIFATLEKAEEYVLYNKPCFTLQEMINLHSSKQHDKYINLAKTKIWK